MREAIVVLILVAFMSVAAVVAGLRGKELIEQRLDGVQLLIESAADVDTYRNF